MLRLSLTFATVDEADVAETTETNDGSEGPELDATAGSGLGRLGGVGTALLAKD